MQIRPARQGEVLHIDQVVAPGRAGAAGVEGQDGRKSKIRDAVAAGPSDVHRADGRLRKREGVIGAAVRHRGGRDIVHPQVGRVHVLHALAEGDDDAAQAGDGRAFHGKLRINRRRHHVRRRHRDDDADDRRGAALAIRGLGHGQQRIGAEGTAPRHAVRLVGDGTDYEPIGEELHVGHCARCAGERCHLQINRAFDHRVIRRTGEADEGRAGGVIDENIHR